MIRPTIRLGLQLPSFTFPDVPVDRMFERVAEIATTAERSGFDAFFVMDHYHQIANIGPPTDPMLEAYTVLAAVAARTSTIRLGALVTGVTYRNPAFLAKVVTSLDVVSAGRAILGIGAAWNDEESRAYGYDWPSTGERFDRLEDALQICRSMFTRPETSFRGTVHHVEGALNVPQPVRPGGPPIMIGGGGERRTLLLTARYADLWNGFGDAATIAHKIDVLHSHCRDEGRDPAAIHTTRLGTAIVASTKEEATRRRDAWQSEKGIDDEAVDQRLTWGDPETIGTKAQALAAAGLDGLIFNMPAGSSPEDVALLGRSLSSALA
jgi:F420-dependent oxidoreductase-like protein